MFVSGARCLEANRDWINELNVFPVPDGDTGTNMTLTVQSAVHELESLGETEDMHALCKAISSGSLRGARGNSGVILSQLLRGFCKVVRDSGEIDIPLAAKGFDKAVETAYKAVMKPKEGTILTVARGMAERAGELVTAGETEDAEHFLREVIAHGDEVLESTPDLLPVLKQAGVVDSGGQGLMQFMKGALAGFLGEEIALPEKQPEEVREEPAPLKYAYSVAYVLMPEKNYHQMEEKDFAKYLSSLGEDVVVSNTGREVSVSLRTNDPGMTLQRGLIYGQLKDIVIENLRYPSGRAAAPALPAPEAAETPQPDHVPEAFGDIPEQEPAAEEAEAGPRKEVGFVTVSAGDGLAGIFRGLGADQVITGGQTMNPSMDDILQAVRRVNADTVFVLPNNKNIIMAANQAATMSEDRKVVVIPTKTIPQGITALIGYIPDADPEVSREGMVEEIGGVRSAEVTYAVRDTEIDGVTIHQGDMMAIGDDGIIGVASSAGEAAFQALMQIAAEGTELISIYYGADVSEEKAKALSDHAKEAFPTCDIELQYGGQPVYYYILSAE